MVRVHARPPPKYHCMPYFFIGLILLLVSITLQRWFKKTDQKGEAKGMTFIIIAAIILMVLYGLYYRAIVLP